MFSQQFRKVHLLGQFQVITMMMSIIFVLIITSNSIFGRENTIVNLKVQDTIYTLQTDQTYTIRELEMMNNSTRFYNILYGIPIYYERRDGAPITALKSVIALFNSTSLGFKAYLVVDPYNVQYSTDIANIDTTLPPLFNETIYGSDFYIKKLLDWQGTDPSVTPQCSYLVNYNMDKSKAEYYNDLFYCDSSVLNSDHVFTLSSSSKKIVSKYDGTCLQFLYKTDSTTKTTVVFQFQTCSNSKLQQFGFNGQYLSLYGDSKVMYVADKITAASGSVYSAPGAIDLGTFSELTNYGRNLNYPYRVYQFYLEPVSGFNETVTISNKGVYIYPPLSFTNQTYIDMFNNNLSNNTSIYLRNTIINRLYTEYQKQKRLPFPIPPDELLYTYIFLPITIFFGGFLFMFISVACCWTFVYIKKTYCKP